MNPPRKPMQAMYWACADALALAARIPASPELPPPPDLKQRISALLDQMASRAAEAGLTRDDVEDARYALVAFLDEQIFQSPWSGKQEWMLEPLQLVYYNENTAGEGFFTRLQAIESRPERLHVLQIYYLCLSLGFQGKYAVKSPDSRNALIEAIAAKLGRGLAATDVLSPHGVPPDVGRRRTGKQLPIIPIAAVLAIAAALAFVVLRIVLQSSASDAASSMQQSAASGAAESARGQGR